MGAFARRELAKGFGHSYEKKSGNGSAKIRLNP
jgi:hypothetical protein